MTKPRKPLGRFWFGNYLVVETMVDRYGQRGLKELHSWLGKVIAWNGSNPKRKAKKK